MADFIKLQEIDLKNSTEINESWIQQTIADNPEILGLGNVHVRDKERKQESGGRLDLLLENDDDENPVRYEVEIQLSFISVEFFKSISCSLIKSAINSPYAAIAPCKTSINSNTASALSSKILRPFYLLYTSLC